jgi:hypothetical protein
VAEDVGDVMARRQAMRPDEGASSMPGFGSFSDIVPDSRMYAVKPGGGNNPLNLGSTKPLSEQRNLGRHLSEVQISDPVNAFENQFETYSPDDTTNYRLKVKWRDYLKDYLAKNDFDVTKSVNDLRKEAAEQFAKEYNIAAVKEENKPIFTAAQFEAVAPNWNAWVMNPYQKYITNQMGTGLPTDPVLKTLDEANVPILNAPNERGRVIKGLFPNLKPLSEYEQEDLLGKRGTAIRKYMLSGADMDSPQYANIGNETATTPSGKTMEAAIDTSFDQTGFYGLKDYPQTANLDKRAVINDVEYRGPSEGTGLPAVRQRVLEEMLQGKILSKDIQKALPANILKKIIDDYKIEQKGVAAVQAAKDDWRAARYDSIESVIPFDDGTKIQIIRPEDVKTEAGKLLALRDLGQSTIDLKQCIGAGCHNTANYPGGHGPFIEPHTGKSPKGVYPYDQTHVKRYMERLEKDKAEIARLIDKDGVSQASVDLHYETPRTLRVSQQVDAIASWLGNNVPQALPEFETNVANFGTAEAVKNVYQLYPEVYQYIEKLNKTPKKFISEMKGADNGEIPEKFVPHMVQWLNSMGDGLSDVRDIKNLPNVHDLDHESNSISKLMDKNQHWYSPTVEKFFDTMENENALPRFFTTDEFALKATERGVDLSAEPKRAEGDQPKYPEGVTNFQKDMIDYFEPGAIRKSYGGHDRIISYDPRTNVAIVSEVKRDPNTGEWIDHPTYGGPRSHSTMPTREEFMHEMGRPMRSIVRQPAIEDELVNAIQQMEPENANEFDRPTEFQRGIVGQNIEDYLQGHFANIENVIADMEEPYATDMRILVGDQRPEARLPEQYHRDIVDALLNQDDHVNTIRYIIDTLQGPGYFPAIPELTTPQLENILNIVISWTERYPLNE